MEKYLHLSLVAVDSEGVPENNLIVITLKYASGKTLISRAI